MATSAVLGQGTLIQRGDGASPENFTTIAEVLSLQGPSLDSDQIDVTHQQSAARTRDYIQGLKDPGEVSFDLNYIPGNATQNATTGILNDYATGVSSNFRLRFPVTPAVDWVFAGFVKSFQPSSSVDEQLKASIVIKVTGNPTLA